MTFQNTISKEIVDKSKTTQNSSRKRFYVEAGAGDGEIISNSLYFEIKYKASICISIGLATQYILYNITSNV